MDKTGPHANPEALLVRIGDRTAGLPVAAVERVVGAVEVTRTSTDIGSLIGHVNVAGELVGVADLGSMLGQPPGPVTVTDHLVLVRWERERLLLKVDEAIGIARVSPPPGQAAGGPGTARATAERAGIGPGRLLPEGGVITLVEPAAVFRAAGMAFREVPAGADGRTA